MVPETAASRTHAFRTVTRAAWEASEAQPAVLASVSMEPTRVVRWETPAAARAPTRTTCAPSQALCAPEAALAPARPAAVPAKHVVRGNRATVVGVASAVAAYPTEIAAGRAKECAAGARAAAERVVRPANHAAVRQSDAARRMQSARVRFARPAASKVIRAALPTNRAQVVSSASIRRASVLTCASDPRRKCAGHPDGRPRSTELHMTGVSHVLGPSEPLGNRREDVLFRSHRPQLRTCR